MNDPDPVPPSRHRRTVARVLVAAVLLTLTAMAVRKAAFWAALSPRATRPQR